MPRESYGQKKTINVDVKFPACQRALFCVYCPSTVAYS